LPRCLPRVAAAARGSNLTQVSASTTEAVASTPQQQAFAEAYVAASAVGSRRSAASPQALIAESHTPAHEAVHATVVGLDQSSGADQQLQDQAAVEEDEEVEIEVTTETEVEIQPLTTQQRLQMVQEFITTTNPGRAVAVGTGALLGATLGMAIYRAYQKANTTRAKRKRQVDRNKALVEGVTSLLANNRAKLNKGSLQALRVMTGFTLVELFRKYLWYLLRERKFDQQAVDDMVALKEAAGLDDGQVADALEERAQRIYDKYGTLMVNTEGMTAAGIERKATCRNLFRKLLYLTETDKLVKQGGEEAARVDLRKIFGATNEDIEKLRIVSLYDVDLEKLFAQGEKVEDDEASDGNVSSAEAPSSPEPPKSPDSGADPKQQQ